MKKLSTVLESQTTTNVFELSVIDFAYDKITKEGFIQIRLDNKDLNLDFSYEGNEVAVLSSDKGALANLFKSDTITTSLDENGMIRSSRKGAVATMEQNRYIRINEAFVRLNMKRITPSDMQQIGSFINTAIETQLS